MIPIPLIALGISATALIIRHTQKKAKETPVNHPHFKEWLTKFGISIDNKSAFDVNHRIENGDTLLIQACQEDDTPIIAALIKAGADLNAMNKEGKTALFYTTSATMTESLIKAGAEINAKDIHGRTAIFYPTTPQKLRWLITNGADTAVRDEEGKTFLFYLSEDYFNSIYNIPNLDDLLAIKDNSGNLPLFYINFQQIKLNRQLDEAVDRNDLLRAEQLLISGADPNNIHSVIDDWSMIHLAIYHKNCDMIKLLIQYGADPNFTPHKRISPLQKAIYDDELKCATCLLNAGAKITKDVKITAIYHNGRKHDEFLKLLCDYGMDYP